MNPRKSTMAVTFRLNINTIAKLMSINPAIVTKKFNGTLKFRHGALGKYLERLILEDINVRTNRLTKGDPSDQVLIDFLKKDGS